VARLRSVPVTQPVGLAVIDIDWDGKRFHVQKRQHELEARATQVVL
jgi:hypothetical protein